MPARVSRTIAVCASVSQKADSVTAKRSRPSASYETHFAQHRLCSIASRTLGLQLGLKYPCRTFARMMLERFRSFRFLSIAFSLSCRYARINHIGTDGASRELNWFLRGEEKSPPAVLTLFFCLAICWAQCSFAKDMGKEMEPRFLVEMARSYEHGEGVPRDMARAIELYCNAARLGDSDAQYNLGWIYANGRGVERNDGLAGLFFAMASAGGVAQADQMLRVVGAPSSETPDCLRTPAEAAHTESPPTDQQSDRFERAPKHIVRLVNRLGPEYGVDPQLALAVIEVESNYNPNARSSKNAQGLMQLIPETSDRFGVKKPYDPEQNLRGGLAYLRWLLAYFRGSVALVAAGYNAGEGAVDRYGGVPPYAETVAYVQRIRRLLQQDRHPFDERVAMPSVALSKLSRAGLLSRNPR